MTKAPTAAPAPFLPVAPQQSWLARFVAPTLLDAPSYKIDTPAVAIKLDQNESPWDLPPAIKDKVVAKLLARAWNRYPSAFGDEVAARLARQCGVTPESVLLGPGSNYLISLLLSVFSKGVLAQAGARPRPQVVIARPSFPLYESHCTYEGIPFTPWLLNADLEYDVGALPDLAPGSLVIFASPNNPVGNTLPRKDLRDLLVSHPGTLFIADEAYYEYATEPYTDLLKDHANLLLLRTFSKTMGCAGVRVGYVLGAPPTLNLLRKVRVPYLLNHFALACAEVLLDDAEVDAHLQSIKANAVAQRDGLWRDLQTLGASAGFTVKRSQANFLLLRWPDTATSTAVYQRLIAAGVLVRNVAGAPGLAGCLRMTLGNVEENRAFLAAMRQAVVPA